MRIIITVNDLTPAQWDWLIRNTEQGYRNYARLDSADVQTTACIVFESPDPSLIETLHREMPVRTWIGIVEHLKTITHTTEALLTPDVLPDTAPYSPGVER